MTFTLTNLLYSIAAMLDTQFPDLPVYINTNQQGTQFPCFFVFVMDPTIKDEIDRRRMRRIGLDIVYIQQRNVPNIDSNNVAMQDALDELFDMITYTDGETSTAIHCYENAGHVTDDDLHYQFYIDARVSTPIAENPMTTESTDVGIKGD